MSKHQFLRTLAQSAIISMLAIPVLTSAEPADFVSLLGGDAKDLNAWHTEGNWAVQDDGSVELTPRPGETGWQRYGSYLWLNDTYSDFILDLEYKHPAGGNSGVYVRVRDPKEPVETGIEVQILDSHGKDGPLGHHDCGGIIRTVGPSKNMAKPAGEWNRMIVTCQGNHMKVELNTEEIIDIQLDEGPMKDRPLKGHIGLQDHGLPLWFRNVRIKEIPKQSGPVALWPSGAPGARDDTWRDKPFLQPYFPNPAKATGAAVVVLPGGGYGGLAPHEGKGYAEWLTQQGLAAFVVNYRLGSHGYRHPAMLHDAARAMRLVRSRADEWEINPERIAIMGSSAGGHLASTLLTHFDTGTADAEDPVDRQSSRPDLGILCYPVITLGEFTHVGSRNNLLGPEPDPELVKELSNELQVTKETPPCFLFHTAADRGVPVENSLKFAAALSAAGVPFDLHVFQQGGHGIGLGKNQGHQWTRDLLHWLREFEFVR
jgi:acetyl esterase/lipase